MELTTKSTKEDILNQLALFKVKAINLVSEKITDKDAKYLEPKEIKTLTDIALNLEDSYRQNLQGGEGEQARKIQRLLNKYAPSTADSNNLVSEAELC